MKQNRCQEHQQDIVALCIDQTCTRKVKAVCPLQLYNQHLNHKFQNIMKIRQDWGVYSNDAKEARDNIDKDAVVRYMDNIINEIMAKVKEHLVLVRKEFEAKLSVYFESKPVGKIAVALEGVKKCLDDRYLDLTHQEIENARFFIQVYGMKKLVNDTYTQKSNFQKQILVAFSKIKEQMFMDYPKFSALVKAKEFQYCQIIKNQNHELESLREKLSVATASLEKHIEENKQLQYDYNRAKNEISNKEATLGETEEKLKIITQKYNEQAKQAIMKAKQIQTKNIFGVYSSKALSRVSDRMLRTGEREVEWPTFADIGEATGKVWIRVNRFDIGGWILLGLMHRNLVEKNQYEFDNYKLLGHGAYLMDNNRWVYSSTDQNVNCKPFGFQFAPGDTIKLEVFESDKIIRFSKMVFGWEEEKFQLEYKTNEKDPLYFCVAARGQHIELQLI